MSWEKVYLQKCLSYFVQSNLSSASISNVLNAYVIFILCTMKIQTSLRLRNELRGLNPLILNLDFARLREIPGGEKLPDVRNRSLNSRLRKAERLLFVRFRHIVRPSRTIN